MKKNKGFTLVELLIVFAIIVILCAIAAVSLSNLNEKDRDAKRIQNMNEDLRIAMQMVLNKYDSYSENLGCSVGDLVNACEGGRLQEFLPLIKEVKDPVGALSCLDDCTRPCNYAWQKLSDNDFGILFYVENGLAEFADPGCYLYGPNGAERYDPETKEE
ncbi:MAG: hypothetical protein UT02_C0035G0006 [Parcubacteria group bacterium GW2011_GWC2_38_7]|nr:MAG: hypothetical protein UT02_C0035G0006 [Parcubacteria group bacterium GW2011_GWC2_38_7]